MAGIKTNSNSITSILVEKLNVLAKDNDLEILMGLDKHEEELPEGLEVEIKVL